jgi:predicted small lipoprotein YifL
MKISAILAALVALSLVGCGVKSDLMPPNGKPAPKHQHDPSRPPQPIGQ